MAVVIDGSTGVSAVQDGVVTAADLASGAITSNALPSGTMVLISEDTDGGTAVSNFDVTLPTSGYRWFTIHVNGIYLSSVNDIYMRTIENGSVMSDASSYGHAGYYVDWNDTVVTDWNGANITHWRANAYNPGTSATDACQIVLHVYHASSASLPTRVHCNFSGINSSDNFVGENMNGTRTSAAIAEGIRFELSGGTMSYTSYELYGVKA